jgi:hypothetical protein
MWHDGYFRGDSNRRRDLGAELARGCGGRLERISCFEPGFIDCERLARTYRTIGSVTRVVNDT